MAQADSLLPLFHRLFGLSGCESASFDAEAAPHLRESPLLEAKRDVLEQWLRGMSRLMEAETAVLSAFAGRYAEALYCAKVTDHVSPSALLRIWNPVGARPLLAATKPTALAARPPPFPPTLSTSDSPPQKKKRKYTPEELTPLKRWWEQNGPDYISPSRDERELMAQESGLTLRQITSWISGKKAAEKKQTGKKRKSRDFDELEWKEPELNDDVGARCNDDESDAYVPIRKRRRLSSPLVSEERLKAALASTLVDMYNDVVPPSLFSDEGLTSSPSSSASSASTRPMGAGMFAANDLNQGSPPRYPSPLPLKKRTVLL